MNTDAYGLPQQLDGDRADQLQRVGMLAVAYKLHELNSEQPDSRYEQALLSGLQPKSGIYSRYTGATTDDVTGDQLIPTIAYWALIGCRSELWLMRTRLLFAQNRRKQGEPNVHTFPDFMVFRAAPLFVRSSRLLYPLALALDSFLVIAVVLHCLTNTGLDDVDDNNLVVTLVVCRARMPTPLSALACHWYKLYRSINYGSIKYNCHPIIGALLWYHRAAWPSYGNPEIALLWAPIIKKYIINQA